jgi:hypothetical protein
VSISLTTIRGSHTVKTGFYNTHSYKAQNQGNSFGTITFTNDANNPLDSQFPFANAALGIFGSYQQQSGYVEGNFVYNNTEGYIQDNWRMNSKLTTRLRTAARAPAAAVRRARTGVKLLHRQVVARTGAPALHRRLRERRDDLLGHEPAGEDTRSPASSSAPTRPQQSARSSPTRATA